MKLKFRKEGETTRRARWLVEPRDLAGELHNVAREITGELNSLICSCEDSEPAILTRTFINKVTAHLSSLVVKAKIIEEKVKERVDKL